jgi:C4-dicarboxylate transporter DctQ subunit
MNKIIGRLEEGILALLLAGMTVLTFTQVVLRYLFNTGFVWALEATIYMFAWLILIGISYGVRVHAHIGIDFVVKVLPPRARRIAGMVAIAFCLLYAGLMLHGSYNYIYRMYRLGARAEDIPVQRWILSIILPIGFALLGLRLLQQARAIVVGKAEGVGLADEAADVLYEQGLVGHGETVSEAVAHERHRGEETAR